MHPTIRQAIQKKRSLAGISKSTQLQQAAWSQARGEGVTSRQQYTDRLQADGADYRNWTNYVYQKLFGATADDLRQGSGVATARDGLTQAQLNLVQGVEARVARSGIPDLTAAHEQAIGQVRRERLINRIKAKWRTSN